MPARDMLLDRRRMVKTLFGALAGGTLAFGQNTWLYGKSEAPASTTTNSNKIETGHEEAESTKTSTTLDASAREYETFLAGLGLIFIKPAEVLMPHYKVRGKVKNSLPPHELWTKMPPTLKVADKLRQQLGVPLVSVISAYRNPAYNAACSGSAAHSQHMMNVALDLHFDCAPSKVVQAAEALRAQGFFKGGIGRYPGFTHIDTRGKNADWQG
ncbi:MAG TPA: D-Ala-D-Ala carboxypeptidase family metallohydrolase [Candidatus Saccharimonadia bacterium]|nr:D-Ala-D-Ala carboxypeptidase family metallohydrolase [Candidatus Saccharimonadia bacterium]